MLFILFYNPLTKYLQQTKPYSCKQAFALIRVVIRFNNVPAFAGGFQRNFILLICFAKLLHSKRYIDVGYFFATVAMMAWCDVALSNRTIKCKASIRCFINHFVRSEQWQKATLLVAALVFVFTTNWKIGDLLLSNILRKYPNFNHARTTGLVLLVQYFSDGPVYLIIKGCIFNTKRIQIDFSCIILIWIDKSDAAMPTHYRMYKNNDVHNML